MSCRIFREEGLLHISCLLLDGEELVQCFLEIPILEHSELS
jgi:hypothetical protein